MARDPRKEPKQGDILKLPNWFLGYEIASVNDTVFFFGRDDRGRMIPMSYCSRNNWSRLMENAEVIRTAD